MPEPGRRLLHDEVARAGSALPWSDPTAFLHRILDLSIADWAEAAERTGAVFFDRSIVDALSGLEHRTGRPWLRPLGETHRYHPRVLLAPPWPDIYVQDEERRHGFARAEAEYHRLARDYPALSYETIYLPRVSVEERADFVLRAIHLPQE